MGWLQGRRLQQLGAPVLELLARQRLDQVQAPAPQLPPGLGLGQPAGRLDQILAAMSSPQGGEHLIIEVLAPQAHPIHPGPQIGGQPLAVKTGRIQFQGDFGAGGDPEATLQGLDQRQHLDRIEQRGGAAAEVDGGQGWAGPTGGDLPLEQGQIGLDRGGARLAGGGPGPIPQGHHWEIAIEAAPMAEGDVQIGAARRIGAKPASAWLCRACGCRACWGSVCGCSAGGGVGRERQGR